MQLFMQLSSFSPLIDEGLYTLHLGERTGFKTARVVENELSIALENELVFDVMQSALNCDERRKKTRRERNQTSDDPSTVARSNCKNQ
jgi:hypothetical protein